MGNISSKAKQDNDNFRSVEKVIDYIASNYILTADFKSLTRLYEEEYCNNLVVLTRDIIARNFNDMELTYLSQRIKGKEVVNEERTDDVVFFNKTKLENLDKHSRLRKKRICEGIAKFYVKIAHIFAAIVTTINPVYTYKDEQGNVVKTPLAEKDTIPKNARDRRISREGMCFQRINRLRRGQDFVHIPEDGNISLHPNICQPTGPLGNEPGIPELQDLYFDQYDYEKGKFTKMKPETEKEYVRDVHQFYKVFTGTDTLPENPPSSFRDIKLTDYASSPQCMGPNARWNTKVPGTLKDELFQKYALTLQNMMRNSKDAQDALLGILNELFTYDVDSDDTKKLVRIHPDLTESKVNDILAKTRQIIVNYYLSCETDYQKGVKLYETIVENQMKDTLVSQISSLEDTRDDLLHTMGVPPSMSVG